MLTANVSVFGTAFWASKLYVQQLSPIWKSFLFHRCTNKRRLLKSMSVKCPEDVNYRNFGSLTVYKIRTLNSGFRVQFSSFQNIQYSAAKWWYIIGNMSYKESINSIICKGTVNWVTYSIKSYCIRTKPLTWIQYIIIMSFNIIIINCH